jgi:predicted nucleotidyltransferase
VSSAERIAALARLVQSLGHVVALVGGLAVSIRARVRYTRDIDLAVSVRSDAEAEALAFAMQRSGLILRSVVEQEEKGVLAALRFRAPAAETDMEVNLLCASSGIEPEIVAASTPVEIAPGTSIPVASVPHLAATKVLAVREGREQDAADLRALLAGASDAELRQAREALRLIQERGFDRGKDLEKELRKYL